MEATPGAQEYSESQVLKGTKMMSRAGLTGDGFGFGWGFMLYLGLQMSEHPHGRGSLMFLPLSIPPISYDPRLTHLQMGPSGSRGPPWMATQVASHNGRGHQVGGTKQEAASDSTLVPPSLQLGSMPPSLQCPSGSGNPG